MRVRIGRSPLAVVGVQIAVTRIRFRVSVPVLSVQITVVEPSVSTADEPLDQCTAAASARTPTASASVIVGSSPSGTFATSSPIAKISRVAAATGPRPGCRSGRNASPIADGDRGDQPGDALDLALQRAVLAADALGQGGDPAELGRHAGREDHRGRLAARAVGTAEHEIVLGTLAGQSTRRRRPTVASGTDSPVSADMSTSTAPSMSRASAETRSPAASIKTSPGTSSAAGDHRRRPSRRTVASVRQVRRQRLDGAFGLTLLGKGEDRVEDDDTDDRRGEGTVPFDSGEYRGKPQQQRQRMGELPGEVARPRRPAAPNK